MKFSTVATLLVMANGLRAAGPPPCPAVAAATTAPPVWDNSGNGMLKGSYYFRYVQYTVGDQYGDLSRAIAMYQSITFDGNGTYTLNALEMDSNSSLVTPCAFTGKGTYSISSSGYGYLTNPVFPVDAIWGLVARNGVFAGSTTETVNGYNDLFVGAPIASPAATTATLKGNYSVAYLNFPDGYVTDVVSAGFQMSPTGSGSIGNVNIQYYKGASGAADITEPVSYFFTNGAGVVTFPSYGPAIFGQEYLYITPDGSFIFGGSPNQYDMFLGVQTGMGITAHSSEFAGLYYQAGIDETITTTGSTVSGSIQTYYGALNATAGNIFNHQRILAPLQPQVLPVGYYAPTYGITNASKFSLAFASGGGYTDSATGRQYVIGANGSMRLGFGVTPALGISIAMQAPGPNPTTGPYINPAGVVNAATYAPFTAGISPSELVVIYGTNLAPAAGQGTSGEVGVTINGVAATVQYTLPGQVAAVAPLTLSPPYAEIQVTNNGVASNVVWEPVYLTTPGVFSQGPDGIGDSQVYNVDASTGVLGSLVTAANPAKAGENVTVYMTGLGLVSPAAGVAFGVYTPANNITAMIGQTPATIAFPNLNPTLTGVDQAVVTIPSRLTPGENTLVISGPDSETAQTTIYIGSGSASAASSIRVGNVRD